MQRNLLSVTTVNSCAHRHARTHTLMSVANSSETDEFMYAADSTVCMRKVH